MAIKRKRPTDSKPSAVKEFTDRVEPRKAFWTRYAKMVAEGSTIITFYGAGGVGKTTLLKKIEDEIQHRDAVTNVTCKYVKYDFAISTDPHEVLKTFKFQLAAYGCAFPLFDAGNYYYSLKTGQDITPPKAKSMMEKIPWLNAVKSRIEKADALAVKATPLLNTAKTFFAATDEVLKTFPVMKTITTCFSIVDLLLVKYMESRQILDDDHKEVRFQLNSRFQEKNPIALYDYLPTLFAMDVADWIQETGNKLVVILDNYEALISATTLATEEQLKRDLWLRGDDGLIFMIPDTLWTIAGRNKLRWDGELAEETEQHLIKALSLEDSDWFLQRAGIENETLRGDLVKLTEGYPIFLDLCVDFYVEYKQRHENEPTIDEFGQKRDEVVARIFRYLDADKDDAAKDMLEFLCVLNVWTDEIAIDIGGQILRNFSRNTYKRVREFTFIQKERAENDDLDLTIYRFDKTIQSILVGTCDEKLIFDVKSAVDEYFKAFFAVKKIFDAKNIFYFKLWANFIVRLTNDAEKLRNQYDNTLQTIANALIGSAKFDAAEEILISFMNKITDKNSAPYAVFEFYLSDLRQAQGKYTAAHELAKSAYEKFSRLFGDENPETVDAMGILAATLDDLGRYDEALTLQEKILAFRTETFGENHAETVNAADFLATTLEYLGKYDESLILQEKVLESRKKTFGDKHPLTVNAMNNLAILLDDLGRYNETLTLQEQVLAARKEIFGEEHPETVAAMNNLSVTMSQLKRFDDALALQEKVLELRKEIFGEEHIETLGAMQNLSISLNDLDRNEEALTISKKVLAATTELFGENHPHTINSMENLAITLENLEKYDESLPLKEKVLELRKKLLGNEHPDTLTAMGSVAWAWGKLGRFDEALELQRTVLATTEAVLGEKSPDFLLAMSNLAWTLGEMKRFDEVLTVHEKILALSTEIFGEEHPATIYAMDKLAFTLENLGRNDEATALREKISEIQQE